MIERCEKCGKHFMDKSEVRRHKMYEHIVPVSPFEENKEGRTTTIYENTNAERKESGNRNHQEKLQKSITTTTSTNVETPPMLAWIITITRVSALPKIDQEALGLLDYNVVLGEYNDILLKRYSIG
jgi:hypothetical protein